MLTSKRQTPYFALVQGCRIVSVSIKPGSLKKMAREANERQASPALLVHPITADLGKTLLQLLHVA